MREPTSYYLPDGRLVFPFDTEMTSFAPWIIGVRGKRGEECSIARYKPKELGRFKTEREAREALAEYASANRLKAAY